VQAKEQHPVQEHEDIVALRRQGYRLTSQRLRVLQAVRESSRFLTAEEIYEAVRPSQPSLDIATVYRTLHWLQQVGLIAPIGLDVGRQRFEYHHRGADHHHLVCERCGHHTHIPDDTLAELRATIRMRFGFEARLDHLVLAGCCAMCRDPA
jgi:Fur family ferric uptake transcriptional regulator